MHTRLTLWTLGLTLIGACGDDKNETTSGDSETDPAVTATDATAPTGTDGASSTPLTSSTDSTDPTGGVTSTTGEPQSTDGGETSDPVETSEATTMAPSETTDGPDPDLVAACMSLCDKFVECGLAPEATECTEDCSSAPGEDMVCEESQKALIACATALGCEELKALVLEQSDENCAKEVATQTEVCGGGDVCNASVGSNRDGTECGTSVECPGKPLQAMECDTKTCTCLEDGMKVGMCPAEAVCLDIAAIQDKSMDCCGF